MASTSLATSPRWASAVNKLAEQKDRLAKRLKNFNAEAPTRRGIHIALMGVGGGVDGLIQKKMPSLDLGGTEVPTSVAAAGLLALISVSGKAGAYSDQLGSIAGGMLACEASRRVQEAL